METIRAIACCGLASAWPAGDRTRERDVPLCDGSSSSSRHEATAGRACVSRCCELADAAQRRLPFPFASTPAPQSSSRQTETRPAGSIPDAAPPKRVCYGSRPACSACGLRLVKKETLSLSGASEPRLPATALTRQRFFLLWWESRLETAMIFSRLMIFF